MQAHAFRLPSPDMLVIGPEPMILRNDYDPNQAWLPFMTGVLVRPSAKPQPPSRIEPNWKEHARGGKLGKAMYRFGPEPQMLLPFYEHRRIQKIVMDGLIKHDFAGWGRTSDDKPLIVHFPKGRRGEIDSALSKSCRFAFCVVNSTTVAFYDQGDAAMFRIMFGV